MGTHTHSMATLDAKNRWNVENVKGKCTNVTVDGSQKIGCVFETVVSACEVINSKKVQVQATGTVPNISIDNSEGVQVYLPKDEKNVEIITSKAVEINIVVPGATDDAEPLEHAVPQQFVTKFNASGKLFTEPVAHVGV